VSRLLLHSPGEYSHPCCCQVSAPTFSASERQEVDGAGVRVRAGGLLAAGIGLGPGTEMKLGFELGLDVEVVAGYVVR
jgi:hypothetical protein